MRDGAPPSEESNPHQGKAWCLELFIEERGVIETPKRRQTWLVADFDDVVVRASQGIPPSPPRTTENKQEAIFQFTNNLITMQQLNQEHGDMK